MTEEEMLSFLRRTRNVRQAELQELDLKIRLLEATLAETPSPKKHSKNVQARRFEQWEEDFALRRWSKPKIEENKKGAGAAIKKIRDHQQKPKKQRMEKMHHV